MTDMMFGLTLKLANGQVIHTRLFGFLDDCFAPGPHAQYYEGRSWAGFWIATASAGSARLSRKALHRPG